MSDFTVSQLARTLQIRRESVKALIEGGWLEGYDAAPPTAKRRAYRVTEAALAAYRKSRQVTKPTSTPRAKMTQQVESFV